MISGNPLKEFLMTVSFKDVALEIGGDEDWSHVDEAFIGLVNDERTLVEDFTIGGCTFYRPLGHLEETFRLDGGAFSIFLRKDEKREVADVLVVNHLAEEDEREFKELPLDDTAILLFITKTVDELLRKEFADRNLEAGKKNGIWYCGSGAVEIAEESIVIISRRGVKISLDNFRQLFDVLDACSRTEGWPA